MSSFQEILEIANNLVPRISPNEAKAKQDNGALIIDIREREEINTSSMVKGAFANTICFVAFNGEVGGAGILFFGSEVV